MEIFFLKKINEFFKKINELYYEIPDEVVSKSDDNPYCGGLFMFPIRLVLDSLYPVEENE